MNTATRSFDNLRLLWLSVLVIALDQLSKYFVATRMTLDATVPLLPHLDLVRRHNTGVAFSMFSAAPALVFVALSVAVSIGILWWLRANRNGQLVLATALTLILGGAVGNAIDRVARGYVVDFVLFYVGNWSFAAFNLADSAITLGAGLLLLDVFLQWRRENAKPA